MKKIIFIVIIVLLSGTAYADKTYWSNIDNKKQNDQNLRYDINECCYYAKNEVMRMPNNAYIPNPSGYNVYNNYGTTTVQPYYNTLDELSSLLSMKMQMEWEREVFDHTYFNCMKSRGWYITDEYGNRK